MSTHPLSDTLHELRDGSQAGEHVSLIVTLTATPTARLTHEISALLNRKLDQPYTFLGNVGDTLNLNLQLNDPGLIATEGLVRCLLKIKGVRNLKAERVCARRGAIYAISLRSSF